MLARKKKRRLKRMREKMGLAAVDAGKDADAGDCDDDGEEDDADIAPLPAKVEGASESSRYECESCGNHFCIDCDVFCHEVVHNCPGCLSGNASAVRNTRREKGVKARANEKMLDGDMVDSAKQQNGDDAAESMDIG